MTGVAMSYSVSSTMLRQNTLCIETESTQVTIGRGAVTLSSSTSCHSSTETANIWRMNFNIDQDY